MKSDRDVYSKEIMNLYDNINIFYCTQNERRNICVISIINERMSLNHHQLFIDIFDN